MTSSRIICKAGNVFDIKPDETFEDLKFSKDGITIFSNGIPYYFFMKYKDVVKFSKTWSLVGEAARQGLKTEDFM